MGIYDKNMRRRYYVKKAKIFVAVLMTTFMVGISTSASAMEIQDSVMAADINIVDLDIPICYADEMAEIDVVNIAPTSYQIDESKEVLNVSQQLAGRSSAAFGSNPNTSVTGTLTESNDMDVYIFSVTSPGRYLLARLSSGNADYVAQLYVVDSETGDAAATSIYGFSGDLIQLNGLPAGTYAFIVFSNNNTYDQDYTLNINATNPAVNIKKAYYLANDLSVFMFESETGDVYGNGRVIYNTSTKTGSNLSWKRTDKNSWGSGYEQRTHSVYNVKVKSISSPVSYSSKHGTSNCAVLLYCDEGTEFSYVHSFYQSGVDHVYESSTEDTTGRRTPRGLDAEDFVEGNQHILVYDINRECVIDFYSTLNIFYAGGYEPQPTIRFY